MNNIELEKKAKNWLTIKLENEGWKVITNDNGKKANKGNGYDFKLDKDGQVRYVEVKVTKKAKFGQRWLEPLTIKAMKTYSNEFYVYLISVRNDEFELKIVDYDLLQTLDPRADEKVWFKFNRLYKS